MPSAFDLKGYDEKRLNIASEMKDMLRVAHEANRELDTEERAKFDRLDTDLESYKRRIQDAQKVNALETEIAESNEARAKQLREVKTVKVAESKNETIAGKAFRAWFAEGTSVQLPDDCNQALQEVGWRGRKEITLRFNHKAPNSVAEARALSYTTGATGQYMIPQDFVRNLEVALLYYNGVRQVADIMRTSNGEALPWPTMNDTGNQGARVSDGNAAADNVDPTFGQTTFNAYTYTSNIERVPNQLLEDNAVDFEAKVGTMLGVRIGRIQNSEFTTGTGTSQPQGIATAATLGLHAAVAGSIALADLINLEHSVDVAYRQQDASWMMHDLTLAQIKTLTTTTGFPIFIPGFISQGTPDRILNYPYTVNNSMDQDANNTHSKIVLFGAMKKFVVRNVNEVKIVKASERYMEYAQTGYVAFFRSDARLLDAGTHPIKYLAA